MTLRDLKAGESAVIASVGGEGATRQHFLDMGVIPGTEVTLIKFAPMGDPMELPEEPGQGLYVLTNKSKQMGAATIFYPDVADKIEALFPNGCYVIPSSIHELLLTSKDTLPPEDIAAMVREINNTQVATEDLLSYKVHEYDPKTRTIGLAGGGKDLGQQKAEEQSSHLGLAWLDDMEKPGRAR